MDKQKERDAMAEQVRCLYCLRPGCTSCAVLAEPQAGAQQTARMACIHGHDPLSCGLCVDQKETQATCDCGKSITRKMVTYEYVPDRMTWVHDHSNNVECDKGRAHPSEAGAQVPSHVAIPLNQFDLMKPRVALLQEFRGVNAPFGVRFEDYLVWLLLSERAHLNTIRDYVLAAQQTPIPELQGLCHLILAETGETK